MTIGTAYSLMERIRDAGYFVTREIIEEFYGSVSITFIKKLKNTEWKDLRRYVDSFLNIHRANHNKFVEKKNI